MSIWNLCAVLTLATTGAGIGLARSLTAGIAAAMPKIDRKLRLFIALVVLTQVGVRAFVGHE
jgi:hypothetical protein